MTSEREKKIKEAAKAISEKSWTGFEEGETFAEAYARISFAVFEQSPNGYQSFGTPQYADSATVMGAAEQIAGENAELMDRLADAPTNDELAGELSNFLFSVYEHGSQPNALKEARAILAFLDSRRPVQGEPTDSWAGRARRAEAALLRVRDIHIATMEALSETFSAVAVTEQGENHG